ncbi:MAG: 5-formyltetrahydrofolate cyclo-ligase [Chroococcopsis gigantea SAG 12.99]|jgi:5-formyltetrahydrofolate cyclo-ligase|nr:5-formyltetrahydrofolate cyclo-ligase [Chlorogloea purpurea SAG 13.99]MDV3000559.1 5-formyltetrahydrofolate cyclo-ligase [Chroococcopsis gigantea SAG 12.99]
MDKVRLRKELIKQRRSLPLSQWHCLGQQLSINLSNYPLFQEAKTVLSYFSFRQEPDLSSLFSLDKNWGFSRCVGDELSWHSWRDGEPLEINGYGIPEPSVKARLIGPAEVDLILIPAVACDSRGYRLGYGGGYFDRLLSSPDWAQVRTVGIIFDFAYLPELPIDPWDKPVNIICTESRII